MANSPKDTIYVDIDDEITGVIDKVQNSSGKLVALVLPKRASVFQSIVNMKLLKRAADSGKKNVVLITSEAGLLPLAGAAGIHVAKTLSSKPEIPLAPSSIIDGDEAVDEDEPLSTIPDDELDKTQSVGELAAATGAAAGAGSKAQDLETVDLDNSTPEEDAAGASDTKTPKNKKNKALKIPNFNRFRLLLGIAILALIILIVGFLVLGSALSKATINISTNASNAPVSLDLNLSTAANSVDTSTSTVPAQYAQSQKTFSEQVPTTGQKNEGTKATGSISINAGQCSGTFPSNIPAGTGASANGQTYIIEDEVTFTVGGGGNHGSQCNFVGYDETNPSNGTNIPITAQAGGASYNVSGVNFTIAGYSGYTANGTASGGTDNIVSVVNQNDITSAENKISTGNAGSVKSGLEGQLRGEGYYPIDATFSPGTPSITPSTQVGSAASTVTVTENITYSMFGVYKSDLQKLIGNSLSGQINTSSQSILDYGIDTANISVNSQSTKSAQLSLSTTAVVGPNLNIANIKKQAAGKKSGDIKSAISADPNVTGVKVSFSPFWAGSAPSNVNKISVIVAKPTNK